MMPPAPPEPALAEALGRYVEGVLGLHFPASRQAELLRGFGRVAGQLGFSDNAACLRWLQVMPPAQARLEVLGSHLTIGETYFFRDTPALDALATGVLAPLIEARRREGRRQLQLWSAGCSTGEEAYTLAILLHRLLPDLADWQLSVLATDVNAEALRRADAGSYGEWSFRDAPAWLKRRYFTSETPGRYTVVPEIRRLVRFGFHNLAGTHDAISGAAGPVDMDAILCRHVLMYFEPDRLALAITRLHASLRDGGWLLTSPSEASRALFPGFAAAEFPGAILFRREARRPEPAAAWPAAAMGGPWGAPTQAEPAVVQDGGAAPDRVLPEVAALRARTCADQGLLADALRWCDQWLEHDKLAAPAHHLRAMVLIEQGQPEAARSALHKALYLVPGFVLAHVALGQLDMQSGASDGARRHFARAEQALRSYGPDELLPGADGLTAGQLAQTLRRLAEPRGTP